MGLDMDCGKMQCRADYARATGREGMACFLLCFAELLSAPFRCNAWLSKSASLKPASIGRLRAGRPETPVNTGLAGSLSGNARFTRGSGQVCGGVS